eukprot:symbB.v1.2.016570.t1/scaffold1263.1/size128093/10
MPFWGVSKGRKHEFSGRMDALELSPQCCIFRSKSSRLWDAVSSQWVSFAKPVQKYGPPQREESGNECSGLSFAPRTLLAYGVR